MHTNFIEYTHFTYSKVGNSQMDALDSVADPATGWGKKHRIETMRSSPPPPRTPRSATGAVQCTNASLLSVECWRRSWHGS